jgi:hypothetical protein
MPILALVLLDATAKSGTGKSHILQALTVKACEQEWIVR